MAISLDAGLKDLSEGIAKAINQARAKQGNLAALSTDDKTSLVAAINELRSLVIDSAGGDAIIDDSATASDTVWSSQEVRAQLDAAIANLVNGAPGALDQINELANAVGNDANFAVTVANALAQRLRVDAVQNLSAAQKLQAGQNLGVGDVTHDFLADFTAALT